MALKFTIKKEKLVLTPQFLMIKEFVNVWESDKNTDKRKAHKLLYFIYLLCDLTEENKLRDTPAASRESEAKFYAFGKRDHKFTKEERKILEPAIEKYIKYNESPEERILTAFDDTATRLRTVIESITPETVENSTNGVISFASNSAILTKGLRELNTTKKLKIDVISAVKNEAMSQKIRGKITLTPLSRGNITLPEFERIFENK